MGGFNPIKKAKKIVKKVTKPVTQVVKNVAKNVKKIGSSVIKGVTNVARGVSRTFGKITNKFGPLGSIALAIAMPYALAGLSAGTTALMNSSNLFLRSVGTIGNTIRTGYQAFNAGMSKTFSTITKSISQTFQKFAPQTVKNTYARISQGAKNLFTASKNKIKQYTPKFRTAKAGTVEVYGVGDPGVSVISSTDAAAAIEAGTLEASQLGKQTLTQPGGWFTKTNSIGVQSDGLVQETINEAYKIRREGFGRNATKMFDDIKARSMELGTYVNDEQIGSYVERNLATSQVSIPEISYAGDMDYYGEPTGKYKIKTEVKDLGATGDYIDDGQGGFRFTGNKTFANEPVKSKYDSLKKAAKKTAFDFGKGLLKPTEPIEPVQFASPLDMNMETTGAQYGGTDITGTAGGQLFARVYGDSAANRLATYYKNMNILSSA